MLPRGKAREQGHDGNTFIFTALDEFPGFPNALLGRHKDQDIPEGIVALDFVHRQGGHLDMALFVDVFSLIGGQVADVHRKHPTGDLYHRGVGKGP